MDQCNCEQSLALQAEVDTLKIDLATMTRAHEEKAQEALALRELAEGLVRHLHDHGCVINRPDSPYREPETALFAKAKSLGIGGEG